MPNRMDIPDKAKERIIEAVFGDHRPVVLHYSTPSQKYSEEIIRSQLGNAAMVSTTNYGGPERTGIRGLLGQKQHILRIVAKDDIPLEIGTGFGTATLYKADLYGDNKYDQPTVDFLTGHVVGPESSRALVKSHKLWFKRQTNGLQEC